MSRENVEIVRRMYEGLNSGVRADALSDEALATIFDPGVELQQLVGLAGTAGTFRGYEGLRQAVREVHEVLEDNRYELLEHAASADRVAFAVRASGIGRASGAPAEIRVGHLFELRAGRIIRWVLYANPEEALPHVEVDPSQSPLPRMIGGGTFRGHDGLRSFFRERAEAWENIEDDCEELIDAGESVISVVSVRGRGRTSGIEVETRMAGVWTIRDGRVIRVEWLPSRAEALEAVGLSE